MPTIFVCPSVLISVLRCCAVGTLLLGSGTSRSGVSAGPPSAHGHVVNVACISQCRGACVKSLLCTG